MKNNKGITLSILVLTVVVLGIIAASVVYTGTNVYTYMKKNEFVAQMQIIHGKVEIMNKEVTSGITYQNAGIDIQTLDAETKTKITDIFNEYSVTEEEQEQYLYFDSSELEKIGVIESHQNVIINFETKSVYSLDGIEIKGIQYRELSEIQNLEK